MVADFTTGRLRARGLTSISGYDPQNVRMTMINEGDTAVTIQCIGTDDYISGPRTNIGNAVQVVAGGEKQKTWQQTQEYLELKSTAGTSQFRFVLESRLEWEQMAFDKAESIYPASLYKIDPDLYPPES